MLLRPHRPDRVVCRRRQTSVSVPLDREQFIPLRAEDRRDSQLTQRFAHDLRPACVVGSQKVRHRFDLDPHTHGSGFGQHHCREDRPRMHERVRSSRFQLVHEARGRQSLPQFGRPRRLDVVNPIHQPRAGLVLHSRGQLRGLGQVLHKVLYQFIEQFAGFRLRQPVELGEGVVSPGRGGSGGSSSRMGGCRLGRKHGPDGTPPRPKAPTSSRQNAQPRQSGGVGGFFHSVEHGRGSLLGLGAGSGLSRPRRGRGGRRVRGHNDRAARR